jgi:hypothetical protein
VEIVPSLQAPGISPEAHSSLKLSDKGIIILLCCGAGFCFIETTGLHILPDVSAYTNLTMLVRCSIPFAGFKADFSSKYHPDTQFTSFKADFPADFSEKSCDGEWTTVSIPFNSFTWDWSSYTGEPIHTCAEDSTYCPSSADLSSMTQVSVWGEGVEGAFQLDLQAIGAAR